MTGDHDATPDVACILTPDEMAGRSREISTLRASYLGAESLEDGYTLRFDGSDEVFQALATFVSHERRCCSFADYTLATTPPFEETRLTITGPDGTETMFGEGLLELLAVA